MTKPPKPKRIHSNDKPLSAEDYHQREQERQKRMRDLAYRCLAGKITMEEWWMLGLKEAK